MTTATARLLEEIMNVGTKLAVRFEDARRELEAEQRQRNSSEIKESPMLADRLEKLEKLLKETREENIKNISELKNELAAERAAREEKENEVAALTVRLSQAEESMSHQKEETSKIWETISQALCQSTTGMVHQDERRVSSKEMESLVSTLVAHSAQAVRTSEQQKEETKKVWEAIYATSKRSPSRADWKIIYHPANTPVMELSRNDGPATCLGLNHLSYLTSLKSLKISQTVDVADLRPLYTMTWLEELKLEVSGFSDYEVQQMSNLTALRRLELIANQVTDAGLAHLTRLGSLRVFVLSIDYDYHYFQNGSISSASMVHVGKLTSLEALDISTLNVNDDGLAHLVPLSKLTWLSLTDHITVQGMEHLKCFKCLKTVWLRTKFHVSQDAIDCLKTLPCLEKVGVNSGRTASRVASELPNVTVIDSHDEPQLYPA